MTLPSIYSQVTWPGVGDVDDCWVIVPLWCAVASGWRTRAQLPTVTTFRSKAGVPDLPTSNGGNNLQALKAVKATMPEIPAYSYVGLPAGFYDRLAKGEIASVSVKSSLLPSALRYGFLGNHQIAVAQQGSYYVMNPLGKMGAPLQVITKAQLNAAAFGLYGDGKFHAVMFPKKPVPPPVVDPKDAQIASLTAQVTSLKAEVTNYGSVVASKDAIIEKLTAKIASARSALL